MGILDKIVATKKTEVAQRKEAMPKTELEASTLFSRSVISMRESLLASASSGIIAEFKRRSPSKGVINDTSTVEEVVKGYTAAGVAGISVLTDQTYFGGHVQDLIFARRHTNQPILRKEFMIDEYQIIEAKAIGADLILLIAEVLTQSEVLKLATFAKSMGLEVLLEMHSDQQLFKINDQLDIIGINNRDLNTFEVDLEASVQLLNQIDSQFVRISESGLYHPETLIDLSSAGFQGFLIGESFMKTKSPGTSCQHFISTYMSMEKVNS